MVAGLGAAGSLGLAFETVPGTYVAPTKFVPIRSESLQYMLDINYTRPIMAGPVDPVHAVKGPAHIEGDIEWEVIEDMFVYFMYATRCTVVKAGAAPYTYTFTPSPAAQAPNKTLSLTVVRNGVVFGYVGCVVGSMELTVDNGLLVATMGIVGQDEAVQSAPTESFPQTVPFGADAYTIEVATVGITDAGSFTWSLDDNAEAQFRLGSLAAQYVKFGERNVSVSIERDFQDATDYNAFKALTAQEIHLKAAKDATHYIDIVTHAAIKDAYETGLDGQGDLITASLTYTGKYDFTDTSSYVLEVGTDENIT